MAKRMSVPYGGAITGARAREEVGKILRRLGCTNIGFMDAADDVLLAAFSYRGRDYQLKASAKGWAAMWLKVNPWNGYRRCSRQNYDQRALEQGRIAVNSILRDMIKGQVTAIETGVLSFEAAFLPHLITASGETVLERLNKDPGVLQLSPPKVVDIK